MTCIAGRAGSPALIGSSTGRDSVWQYMMPASPVDPEACPSGHGSGIYSDVHNVQSIVAVVGTAHVRGITEHLKKLSSLIAEVK